ncbi:MAG: hypothetical protein M3133_06010, partial [Actinomycetota bacterium]|nr:hypothetical protein [Actinomycetota bacterium]
MRKGALTAVALAALVAAPVAVPPDAGAAARGPRAAKVRLKAFRSCTGLVRYARRHALRTFGEGTSPR